ncbi:hypothetical protein ACQR1W_02875 [Bradyrhizobium sp. HKCCYLS1011]
MEEATTTKAPDQLKPHDFPVEADKGSCPRDPKVQDPNAQERSIQ